MQTLQTGGMTTIGQTPLSKPRADENIVEDRSSSWFKRTARPSTVRFGWCLTASSQYLCDYVASLALPTTVDQPGRCT